MGRTCSVETAGKVCALSMRQTAVLPTDGGPQYVILTCDRCDHRTCHECKEWITDGAACACPVGHPV